ncbi:MAG: CHAT domain-containing protein, partial [Cyanobacteria bacterium J06560_2]
MAESKNTRDISIGGSVSGSSIIVGDGNVVSSQTLAEPSSHPSKRKILILTANPKGSTPLRLDEEVRDISEGLKRAEHRDAFEIAQRWAVRPRDFQRAMLEELPQIVHFSGHGEGEAGLYFEDEVGAPKLVAGSALASLFRLFSLKAKIECVVLNGCYSAVQATAITQHVPYAIGMTDKVGDKAAIEFVVGFYDALG